MMNRRHTLRIATKRSRGAIDHIAQINALTRNARNTWFALLAALVFVGITLAGVQHIDFYGVDRATQLPLVNVAMPTRLFFLAAPILTAAIYVYFHIYLIRLFDALGKAPSEVNGQPLSKAIAPWLINDAVLWLRARHRQDGSHPTHSLDWLAAFFNITLAWAFGLFVLGYSWYVALPARNYVLNGAGAFAFALSLTFAITSYILLREAMIDLKASRVTTLRRVGRALNAITVMASALLSIAFAHPESPWLARLNLSGEDIVERPDGWLPYEIARRDFLNIWVERERANRENLTIMEKNSFEDEWQQRRYLALSQLDKPRFYRATARINFTGALLNGSFLSGMDMSFARLERARIAQSDLEGIKLIGADLGDANLQGTQLRTSDLSSANMEQINLKNAQLNQTNLFRSNLNGANFEDAILIDVNLQSAEIEEAHLVGVTFERVSLNYVNLRNSNLRRSKVSDADFRNTQMRALNLMDASLERADFRRSQMNSVRLGAAKITNSDMRGTQMQYSFLNQARFKNVDLRQAQLQGANLREATLEDVDLERTNLHEANISLSLIKGSNLISSKMELANLKGTINNGGALRFIDLTGVIFDDQTDFRNAFMDSSIKLDASFRSILGDQCQSALDARQPLSEEEFYGRWRGWVEHETSRYRFDARFHWRNISPPEYLDVTAIPPRRGCVWKKGPIQINE
jgi:uncharacterized protein YjbI with pentapeptide repeats